MTTTPEATPTGKGTAKGTGNSEHPALTGRELQMAALTDQVRRLIHLSVSCDLTKREAETIAAQLKAINERLEDRVPHSAHPRIWPRQDDSVPVAQAMIDAMPYDVVVGVYNPLAPPLSVDIRPPKAYANARFGPAHEGAPGWVHGAVIAGAFDIVLTAANHLEAAAGPTTRLQIRYLRPTLIDQDAHFEAWIERRHRNRVVSKGQLIQDGSVKVEAEGEFVVLDRHRITAPWKGPSFRS